MKNLFFLLTFLTHTLIILANQSPVIQQVNDITMCPSSRVTIPVYYTDPDISDKHFISITSNNPLIYIENISGNTSGSTFEIVTDNSITGIAEVTVEVKDNSGASNASATINFKVIISSEVKGLISNNTTWNDGKVLITGDVTIDPNVFLTIMPGTIIEFQDRFSITIKGGIIAQGKINDTIIFTCVKSKQSAGWKGMIFNNPASITIKSQISYCKFQFGKADLYPEDKGGAIRIINQKDISITNSIFMNNEATRTDGFGGAIYCHNSVVDIKNNQFFNNKAQYGGTIYADSSTGNIENNFIKNNSSNSESGGITSYYSSFNISGNSILNNSGGIGGGIEIYSNYSGLIQNNIIMYNTAESGGGIALLWSSGIKLLNNIISSNTGLRDGYYRSGGGAIYTIGSEAILVNNTMCKNEDYGLYVINSELDFFNNIIFDNKYENSKKQVVPEESTINFNYCLVEGGKENFGEPTSSSYEGKYYQNIDTLPYFSDPERGDYTLRNNSPCINAGISDTTGLFLPSHDVLGNQRILNGRIDIGAVEFNGIYVNRRPALTRTDDMFIKANDTASIPVEFTDADTSDKHTISVISDNPNITITNATGDTSGGFYKIIPLAGYEGSANITVKVSDDSKSVNSSDSFTYKLQVVNTLAFCGTISKNTVWNMDTVKINCDITVARSVLLTIQPGTVIEMQGNYTFNIQGRLMAVGSKNDSIVFTSRLKSNMRWGGIVFNFDSHQVGYFAPDDSSKISYCRIEYATTGILNNDYNKLLIEHSLIRYNNNRGITCNAGASVSDNVICFNTCSSDGGGLYVAEYYANIINNFIYNNSSNSNGGGVAVYGDKCKLTGNIIAKNTAILGGGIYVDTYDTVFIINNTIVDNHSSDGGGLYCWESGVFFVNNIVWGNIAPAGPQISIYKYGLSFLRNSTIQGGTDQFHLLSSAFSPFNLDVKDILQLAPAFTDPAKMDYSLQAGSYCINSGYEESNVTSAIKNVDLRGNKRIKGNRIDIGAIEYQNVTSNRLPVLKRLGHQYVKPSGSGTFIVSYDELDTTDVDQIYIESSSPNVIVNNQSGDTSGSSYELVPTVGWKGDAQIIVKIKDLSNQFSAVNTDTFTLTVSNRMNVCGAILNNTTWSVDTVMLACSVEVLKNATLTINPGTVIISQGNYIFMVSGKLSAIGTSAHPIIFTCIDTVAGWQGIQIPWQSNSSSVFDYCHIFHSNYYAIDIEYFSGNINIMNCLLESNNYGIMSRTPGIISNNVIRNNKYSGLAGYSNQIIEKNSISNNGGAGISCEEAVSTQIRNNIISHNTSGIWSNQSILYIANNIISENSGTGISCYSSNYDNSILGTTYIVNNLIINNHGNDGGGITVDKSSSYITNETQIMNNTICNNSAYYGGGVFISGYAKPLIKNCIIYNNTDNNGKNQLHLYNTESSSEIINSDIEGWQDGVMDYDAGTCISGRYENNFDAVPQFAGINDFHLNGNSICINYGTDTTGMFLPLLDIDGNNRIYIDSVNKIDLGAYEFQGIPSNRLPILKKIGDQTAKVNTPLKLSVNYTELDGNDSIQIIIASDNPNVLVQDLSGNISGSTYKLVPINNWLGTAKISVTVMDKSKIVNDTCREIFNLTVNSSYFYCGDIVKNITWDIDTIKINCNIRIQEKVVLTIKKGTCVEFQGNYGISGAGSIIAEGTESDPVTFCAKDTALGWGGIKFEASTLQSDSIIFNHCVFKNAKNKNYYGGGALSINNRQNVLINNCFFLHNEASYGGALYLSSTPAIVKNSIFTENYAPSQGGAICCSYSTAFFMNNLVYKNLAETGGGMYFESSNHALVINCTIVFNTASDQGGGVFCNNYFGGTQHIINCIIFYNQAPYEPQISASYDSEDSRYDYCNIQGLTIKNSFINNCYNINPQMVDISNNNYRLGNSSPCINKGKPSTDISMFPTDLDGNPRISGSMKIDLGAYEFQNDPPILNKSVSYVNENILNGAIADTIKATDPNGDSIKYFFNSNSLFKADSISGIIKYIGIQPLNYESLQSQILTLTLVDNSVYHTSSVWQYTIRINDLNDNAPELEDETLMIDENLYNGAIIHTLNAKDLDKTDSLSYSLIDITEDSIIDIWGNKMVVKNATLLDFENGKDTLQYKVVVNDGLHYDTANYTIIILNINDIPCKFLGKFSTGFDTITINENPANKSKLYKLSAFDPDFLGYNFYIAEGNIDSAFSIIDSIVIVIDSAVVNYEKIKQFNLKILVSDGFYSDTALLTININNINDAPVLESPFAFRIPENSVKGTYVGKLNVSDEDGDSVLVKITHESIPGAFSFDIASRTFRVLDSSMLDYETNKTFREDILLTDLKDTTYGVILINLENVNDNAPSIEKTFDIIYVSDTMNNDELVYKIIAKDSDNSILDYSITEDQYNLFYLIGNNVRINNPSVIGTIKLLSYNIVISISDGAHNCTLTLWVRDRDENIANVKFYPNPCSDNLIVEIGPERKTNTIEIANLKGQNVYETIIGKNELGLKKINLGFLNNGYYIIKFNGDNFVDKSKLLIYR